MSEECPIHPNYKEAMLKAKDSGTVVTGRTAARRCAFEKRHGPGICGQRNGRGGQDGAGAVSLWAARAGQVFDGDVKNGSPMAGQVTGQLGRSALAGHPEELYAGCGAHLGDLEPGGFLMKVAFCMRDRAPSTGMGRICVTYPAFRSVFESAKVDLDLKRSVLRARTRSESNPHPACMVALPPVPPCSRRASVSWGLSRGFASTARELMPPPRGLGQRHGGSGPGPPCAMAAVLVAGQPAVGLRTRPPIWVWPRSPTLNCPGTDRHRGDVQPWKGLGAGYCGGGQTGCP